MTLLCLGLSLPAAGGAACICIATFLPDSEETGDGCCNCCDSPDEDIPCCLILEKLPDAQVPAGEFPVPELAGIEIAHCSTFTMPVMAFALDSPERPANFRDPTPAGLRRVMHSVWRL